MAGTAYDLLEMKYADMKKTLLALAYCSNTEFAQRKESVRLWLKDMDIYDAFGVLAGANVESGSHVPLTVPSPFKAKIEALEQELAKERAKVARAKLDCKTFKIACEQRLRAITAAGSVELGLQNMQSELQSEVDALRQKNMVLRQLNETMREQFVQVLTGSKHNFKKRKAALKEWLDDVQRIDDAGARFDYVP
jgi:hypothetical protein